MLYITSLLVAVQQLVRCDALENYKSLFYEKRFSPCNWTILISTILKLYWKHSKLMLPY